MNFHEFLESVAWYFEVSFFVTHKLRDAKEPVKALQLMAGEAEICQIPETSLILSSAWALLVFYRHSL